jgi:pyridoxine kinase
MPANHNTQKKIAAISDLTGFGRCALTVTLPLVSHMGIQCCPMPTAIFSNHTAYPEYSFFDYTSQLTGYMESWEKLGLRFEGIMSGFLGSLDQIALVEHFITRFGTRRTQVIVDPIMGDHGKIYATYTEEMCQAIRRLVALADIVTPNITELCKLTDTPYKEKGWKKKELLAMAEEICALGPEKIVVTGIAQGSFIANYVYEKGEAPRLLRTYRVGTDRSGTGDVFAAIIAADAVAGLPFAQSVKKASRFVKRCIARSIELDIPKTDGVCFEELLYTLK